MYVWWWVLQVMAMVREAPTPELAAWTGRQAQRRSPHLVRINV
jgi:glutathione S-transferase